MENLKAVENYSPPSAVLLSLLQDFTCLQVAYGILSDS